jgi:hypothetical protein
MKRNSLLQNAVTALLVLAVFALPPSLTVSGQGTTATAVFFSNEVYIIPGASGGICTYAWIGQGWVGLDAGWTFAGSVSSDNPRGLTFAIMSTDQYMQFAADDINKGLDLNPGAWPTLSSEVDGTLLRHTCTDLADNYMYHNQGQSFQFQWTLTANDVYYFVMLNPNSDSIRVAFSLNLITTGTGPPGWSRTGFTNSLASTYHVSSFATETPMGTASITGPLSLPFDSTYLAIGLAVVVLVGFLLWLARSPRKSWPSAELTAPARKQEAAQISKEGARRQFCASCGRQVPVGSRFCGKCGAPQTQA